MQVVIVTAFFVDLRTLKNVQKCNGIVSGFIHLKTDKSNTENGKLKLQLFFKKLITTFRSYAALHKKVITNNRQLNKNK